MNKTAFRLLAAAGALCAFRTAAAQNAPDDPYLWLEEVESPKALEWVKARNARSLDRLTGDPRYPAIEAEVRKILLATDRLPEPDYQGGFIYNFWQDANHVRGIWRRTSLASYAAAAPKWDTVLDIDKLAAKENENWVWKGAQCLPPEHNRCLVSLSRGGKDAAVIREFEIPSREFVPASRNGFEAAEAKSDAAWIDRDTILIGTDFGPGSQTKSGYARIVKRWKRGTPLSAAEQVFEVQESDVVAASSSYFRKEGTTVLLYRMKTFFSGEHWLLPAGGQAVRLNIPEDADLRGLHQGRALVLLRSEWKANGRIYRTGSLVAVKLEDAASPKPEVILEPGERVAIGSVADTSDGIYIRVLDNVKGRIQRATLQEGRWVLRPVPLPDNGTVQILAADPFRPEVLFSYESFLKPMTVYLASGDPPRAIRQRPDRFDSGGMTAEQFEARSADGSRIPYFVVRRTNLRSDGNNPTLLYAYGGFEVPQLPGYLDHTGKVWLERGGIYVLANIRGGGEFGPKWHDSVLKENRPKVFEDFIGVAEDLVRRGLTKPAHLGIAGGSNGGLLVGATFVKRPDLFRAVFCGVPLLDMLRYHRLLAGNSWMGEYGDPDDPKLAPVLRSYSPYQNVRKGVRYPRVFFYTSTKDDRVHPGHARKMAARMEEQGHELLYYENTEGGHAASANLEQRVKRYAMQYTYLLQELHGPAEAEGTGR